MMNRILRIHIENCTCGELCVQNVFDICSRRQSTLLSSCVGIVFAIFVLVAAATAAAAVVVVVDRIAQLQQQLQTTEK